MKRFLVFVLVFVPSLFFMQPVYALVIDFDTQGASGPSTFREAGPEQVITYIDVLGSGIDVTFEGGVMLDGTLDLFANQTALYGTSYFGDSTLDNPLKITFNKRITNFFLDINNGLTSSIDYHVFNDEGNSAVFSLDRFSEGETTQIGLAGAGTVVWIEGVTPSTTVFNFFIDNINFDESLASEMDPIPEPTSLLLLASGLSGIVGLKRRLRK